jgi:hypothetical protein
MLFNSFKVRFYLKTLSSLHFSLSALNWLLSFESQLKNVTDFSVLKSSFDYLEGQKERKRKFKT